MTEFTWRPQDVYQVDNEPRVTVVNFGEGYEQRQKNGINNQLLKYNLTFRNPATVGKAIDTFLKARGAVESFQWLTSDDNKMKSFVCRSWSTVRSSAYWETSCVFEEVVA